MDMLTDFYLEKCESSAIIFSQVRQVVFHYLRLHKHFFRKLTTLVPLIWVIGHEVLHIRDYKTILFSHIDLFFFNLAAPCLGCGRWDRDLCSMQDLQLQHANSTVACGIYFPDQGSNPSPLRWELGVLASGPPGKYQPCRSDFNEI